LKVVFRTEKRRDSYQETLVVHQSGLRVFDLSLQSSSTVQWVQLMTTTSWVY